MNTVILAAMKTAISVPDEVFHQVNRAAERLGISRSEVFTRAVRQFLLTARDAEIAASYDAAFGEEEAAPESDAFRRSAARRALLAVEWDDR